jgi:hypothetical protein
LRTLIGAAPNLPSLWIRLATALEASGQISEALRAWTSASLLVPNSEIISAALSRLNERASSEESGSISPVPKQAEQADPVEPPSGSSESDRDDKVEHLDIDTLITDLQSGRREPTLDLADVEDAPDQGTGSDLVVSETLARIYETQNHLGEAVKIYEALADREKDANKADVFRARAADLRKRIP